MLVIGKLLLFDVRVGKCSALIVVVLIVGGMVFEWLVWFFVDGLL